MPEYSGNLRHFLGDFRHFGHLWAVSGGLGGLGLSDLAKLSACFGTLPEVLGRESGIWHKNIAPSPTFTDASYLFCTSVQPEVASVASEMRVLRSATLSESARAVVTSAEGKGRSRGEWVRIYDSVLKQGTGHATICTHSSSNSGMP